MIQQAMFRKLSRVVGTVALIAVLVVGGLALRHATTESAASKSTNRAVSVSALMGGEATGFARAVRPRPFAFPADHGAHPDFQHEWWYFTGHLDRPNGLSFGYQVTFFRFALQPLEKVLRRESRWATNDIFLAHFALTNAHGGEFFSYERVARGALDLGGASTRPVRIWVGDWQLQQRNDGSVEPDVFSLQIRAKEAAVALTLVAGDDYVLQGDAGLSQKSAGVGQASYYYSAPRMHTQGTVRIGDEEYKVEGESWFDREWGSASLGRNQVGWDWFALHLDDGRALMLYRMRTRDGQQDPFSAGVLVEGAARRIFASDEMRMEPLRYWTSPESAARYPVAWRLDVPGVPTLVVEAALSNQEINHSVRYWEGAVQVRIGELSGPLTGRGYMELVGYAAVP